MIPANHHVCPVCGATAAPGRTGRVYCDGKRIGTKALDDPKPHLTTRCLPPDEESDE